MHTKTLRSKAKRLEHSRMKLLPSSLIELPMKQLEERTKEAHVKNVHPGVAGAEWVPKQEH